MKAGEEQGSGILSLFALPLIMKVLGKGVTTARTGYNNRDHTDKSTQVCSILSATMRLLRNSNYKPRFSDFFSKDDFARTKAFVRNLEISMKNKVKKYTEFHY